VQNVLSDNYLHCFIVEGTVRVRISGMAVGGRSKRDGKGMCQYCIRSVKNCQRELHLYLCDCRLSDTFAKLRKATGSFIISFLKFERSHPVVCLYIHFIIYTTVNTTITYTMFYSNMFRLLDSHLQAILRTIRFLHCGSAHLGSHMLKTFLQCNFCKHMGSQTRATTV